MEPNKFDGENINQLINFGEQVVGALGSEAAVLEVFSEVGEARSPAVEVAAAAAAQAVAVTAEGVEGATPQRRYPDVA
eukprot:11983710-Alexandrium_andersonii.AAC.1